MSEAETQPDPVGVVLDRYGDGVGHWYIVDAQNRVLSIQMCGRRGDGVGVVKTSASLAASP